MKHIEIKHIKAPEGMEFRAGYSNELRITKSDHPRFKQGRRFDYGFMQIALEDGYKIIITPK